MWPDEILNWMQAPVEIDGSYRFWLELNGGIPADEVENSRSLPRTVCTLKPQLGRIS